MAVGSSAPKAPEAPKAQDPRKAWERWHPHTTKKAVDVPALHKFLKKYGHERAHSDEHIKQVVGSAKSHAEAIRNLVAHPAFFKHGRAVAPGEHKLTGKQITPRRSALALKAPEGRVAKAASPAHVGRAAFERHTALASEFEKRADKTLRQPNLLPEHPRFTLARVKLEAHQAHQERERDIARVATAYSTSAQAHHESARAARMHSASAHLQAAETHKRAAQHQALYGDLKASAAHKEHASAHEKAATAVRALTIKPTATSKRVAWLKKASATFTIKPSNVSGASGGKLSGWRAATSSGGKSARKSGWAAWRAKKAAMGIKV